MSSKINTFDEALDCLYRAKKEYAASFFVRTKLDILRRLLGRMATAGMLFHRKAQHSVSASKEIVRNTSIKLRKNPWKTLAYAACISFIAGLAARKILTGKQKY